MSVRMRDTMTIGDYITYRNWKASNNGRKGEEIALERFPDLEFVNSLIDAYLNDIPIEIKTCQEWHNNGKNRCHGRFTLDEEQHRFLTQNNGMYLFIVLLESGSVKLKFVKARSLPFKRRIMWTKIFTNNNKRTCE